MENLFQDFGWACGALHKEENTSCPRGRYMILEEEGGGITVQVYKFFLLS